SFLRTNSYNLRQQPIPGCQQLVSYGPGNSFIIFQFPPQHITEQAFAENNPGDPLLPPPVAARMAGESQLVFYVDSALLPLKFTLESILQALPQCATLIADRYT